MANSATDQLEAKVADLTDKLKESKKDLAAVKKTARDADVARLELIETRKKLDSAKAKVKRLKVDLDSDVANFEMLAGIAFKKSIDPRQKVLPFTPSHEDVGPDNKGPKDVKASTAKGRLDRDNIPLHEIVAQAGDRRRSLKAEWIETLQKAGLNLLLQLKTQIAENGLKNIDGLSRSNRTAIIATVKAFDQNRKDAEVANLTDKRLNDRGLYFEGYNRLEVIPHDDNLDCPTEIRTIEGADGLWRAGSIVNDRKTEKKDVRPIRRDGTTSKTQNEAIFRESEDIRKVLLNGKSTTKRTTQVANAISAWVGKLTAAKS